MNFRWTSSFALLGAMTLACGGTSTADIQGESELRHASTKTDAQVRAEVEHAADGLLYGSETDAAYTWVTATLDTPTITEAAIRAKLGRQVSREDGPIESQFAEERPFAHFRSQITECGQGEEPATCAKTEAFMRTLETDLKDIKVFYFGATGSAGHVDGVSVTIFIVGITPQGHLGGVRTLAVWT